MHDKFKKFWKSLGPGLITGASDDDPSGIATYSIAGAKFGLSVLWMAIFTLPFMITIQRMAGRIGLISGKGIAGNMKKHYPRFVLVSVALMAVAQNIINIGADISGMAATFVLTVPISPLLYSVILVAGIVLALVFIPYYKLASYLKWVAIVMFSYVMAAFFVQHDWSEVFKRTVIPEIHFSKDYFLMIIAILGTTISPYLFFWQASEQVEEERVHVDKKLSPKHQHHKRHPSNIVVGREINVMYKDIKSGMFFSNLIMFFVIVMAASTLFNTGHFEVETMEQVASVLKPLAGQYANILFLIGITAAGVLAIPVLAGSAAYVMAETFGWKDGLNHRFDKAKAFYTVIAGSTVLGLLIPVFGFDPVKALFYTAILHGITAPFLIFAIIHMANNPKIMGKYINRHRSNVVGYILFLIMSASTILLFFL